MIEFEKYEQDTEFENQPKSIVHEEQNLMQTENDVICELNENFEENFDQSNTLQENIDVKGQHFLSVLNGFQKNEEYIDYRHETLQYLILNMYNRQRYTLRYSTLQYTSIH